MPYPNPPKPQGATPLHRGHTGLQHAHKLDKQKATVEKMWKTAENCGKLQTSSPPPPVACCCTELRGTIAYCYCNKLCTAVSSPLVLPEQTSPPPPPRAMRWMPIDLNDGQPLCLPHRHPLDPLSLALQPSNLVHPNGRPPGASGAGVAQSSTLDSGMAVDVQDGPPYSRVEVSGGH